MMASRTKAAWTAPRSGGYSAVVNKDKKRGWLTLRDSLTGRFTKPAPLRVRPPPASMTETPAGD